MRHVLHWLWKYRFAVAVIAVVLALNLIPERVVERLRSSALELAVLLPSAKQTGKPPAGSVESLLRENAVLRAKVRQIEGKVAILERELAAYGMLREVFPDEAKKSIGAGVLLKRDVTSHRRTILIDRGRKDGVAIGMPVVTGRTLVGVVISAGGRCSRVQLVTDPAFRVVGRLAASGDEGIVEGTSGRDCLIKMHYVRNADAVKIGGPVLTAGTLGRFPRGLVIGSVAAKPSRPENGFRWVALAPGVAVETLESVAVIRGYPRAGKLEREATLNSKKKSIKK